MDRVDPREAEKNAAREYINDAVSQLTVQMEGLEAKVEALGKPKKKRGGGSAASQVIGVCPDAPRLVTRHARLSTVSVTLNHCRLKSCRRVSKDTSTTSNSSRYKGLSPPSFRFLL